MLKPAILFKSELENIFTEIIYSEDYLYYSGYAHEHNVPKITLEYGAYQYAIIENDTIIGFLAYRIDATTDSVYNFGLISFQKGNITLVSDALHHFKKLVAEHNRIEWRCVEGNPVSHLYDRICKRFGGSRFTLHQVSKNLKGEIVDSYIYEILKNSSGTKDTTSKDCKFYFNGECTHTYELEQINASFAKPACKDFEQRTVYKVEDLPENQTLISKSDVMEIIRQCERRMLSVDDLYQTVMRGITHLPTFCQDDLLSDNARQDDIEFAHWSDVTFSIGVYKASDEKPIGLSIVSGRCSKCGLYSSNLMQYSKEMPKFCSHCGSEMKEDRANE